MVEKSGEGLLSWSESGFLKNQKLFSELKQRTIEGLRGLLKFRPFPFFSIAFGEREKGLFVSPRSVERVSFLCKSDLFQMMDTENSPVPFFSPCSMQGPHSGNPLILDSPGDNWFAELFRIKKVQWKIILIRRWDFAWSDQSHTNRVFLHCFLFPDIPYALHRGVHLIK